MIYTDAAHVLALCLCSGLLGALLTSLVGRMRRP